MRWSVERRRARTTVGILACLTSVVACDAPTQHQVLTTIADGVPPYEEWLHPKPPPPRPPRGSLEPPRRELPPKVIVRADLPMGTAGFPATLEDLTAKLPHRDDEIDWTRAIAEGVIAPRNTIPPAAAEEQTILPLDLERRADDPASRVVFPHEPHTRWLACDNCHPAPFEMKAGAMPMSMDQIMSGQGCGACHGTVAFPATSCVRCHPGMAG